jgi:hypothetical protein
MTVSGTVVEVRPDEGDSDRGIVVLEVTSRVGDDVTVGPGRVEVTLPRAGAAR